jgi:hypothetical protein
MVYALPKLVLLEEAAEQVGVAVPLQTLGLGRVAIRTTVAAVETSLVSNAAPAAEVQVALLVLAELVKISTAPAFRPGAETVAAAQEAAAARV